MAGREGDSSLELNNNNNNHIRREEEYQKPYFVDISQPKGPAPEYNLKA